MTVERVLVVEDNEALARAIESALAVRFASVRRAGTCQEARAFLRDWQPQLLILDVNLPDGSALELVNDPADIAPAVVAMSGTAEPLQSFELGQCGVRVYLPKPITLPALDAAIDRALCSAPPLHPALRQAVGHRALEDVMTEVRVTMTREAMARSKGSRRGAAKLLATSRQVLQYILRRR